jgi:hypothetical protein
VRENSVVPPGLESFLPLFPALKRWAKLGRPSGACRRGFGKSVFRAAVSPRWLKPSWRSEAGRPLKLCVGQFQRQSPRSNDARKAPLPASLLSILTFRSGRNGGPAPGGSKSAHPGGQSWQQNEAKSLRNKDFTSKSLFPKDLAGMAAKLFILKDRKLGGVPPVPTSKHKIQKNPPNQTPIKIFIFKRNKGEHDPEKMPDILVRQNQNQRQRQRARAPALHSSF